MLAVLNRVGIPYSHVPPGRPLRATNFDAFILSDYSRKDLSARAEAAIVERVEGGAGLLMIGGWGSFSGPFGGYRDSRIEKLLPVSCRKSDDRTNFPGGASLLVKHPHEMFAGLSFQNPPVICGLNSVAPKPGARVVLEAKRLRDGARYPLLIVDRNPAKRVAALTTDLAPHWCGGLVDWGGHPLKLGVDDLRSVEVGRSYVRFVSSLIRWLVPIRPRAN